MVVQLFIIILFASSLITFYFNSLRMSHLEEEIIETFSVHNGEITWMSSDLHQNRTISSEGLTKQLETQLSTNNQSDNYNIENDLMQSEHIHIQSSDHQNSFSLYVAFQNFDLNSDQSCTVGDYHGDGDVQDLQEEMPSETIDQSIQTLTLLEPAEFMNELSMESVSENKKSTQNYHNLEKQFDKMTNEKNDSKNVPKGMMKAFAHMVLSKDQNIVRILRRYFEKCEDVSFQKYREHMRKIRKSSKISIEQIRTMLLCRQYATITRELGYFFLRKMFISHIWNSKMQKTHIHMKYINRWKQIFRQPQQFTSLK